MPGHLPHHQSLLDFFIKQKSIWKRKSFTPRGMGAKTRITKVFGNTEVTTTTLTHPGYTTPFTSENEVINDR